MSDSLLLTPDSTGGTTKKARRQTAIYPHSKQSAPKPFSRSAAKRESVMALGSIEHLQYYFTKTGLAAKKRPGKLKGLVPAIGGGQHVRTTSTSVDLGSILPPTTPLAPTHDPPRPAFLHVQTDPESLIAGVVDDLNAVAVAWEEMAGAVDVLALLQQTTNAIRSVRNYVVALPDEAAPLALIRKAALEVLTVLRALEERCRLPETERPRSTSPMPVPPRYSVPVWEESDDEEQEEDTARKDAWDEKLVVGGWLYTQDLAWAELNEERAVVCAYLDVVDDVLFGGPRDGARGWEHARKRAEKGNRRRVSTGEMPITEEPEPEPHSLPLWARPDAFAADDYLGRAHALISTLLPEVLLGHLNPGPELLDSLSSGQLLCVAYNAAVRKSREPWGYVAKHAIHDLIAGASEAQWTFRRTDNLRMWAGALKLRYLVPIVQPDTQHRVTDAVQFDARVVARREDGWEAMLGDLVRRWVDKVVEETRAA